METHRFNIETPFQVENSYESYPIYDDVGVLVGACTLRSGEVLACFVSLANNPIALLAEDGGRFYFTPKIDAKSFLISGIISEYRLNKDSIKV